MDYGAPVVSSPLRLVLRPTAQHIHVHPSAPGIPADNVLLSGSGLVKIADFGQVGKQHSQGVVAAGTLRAAMLRAACIHWVC